MERAIADEPEHTHVALVLAQDEVEGIAVGEEALDPGDEADAGVLDEIVREVAADGGEVGHARRRHPQVLLLLHDAIDLLRTGLGLLHRPQRRLGLRQRVVVGLDRGVAVLGSLGAGLCGVRLAVGGHQPLRVLLRLLSRLLNVGEPPTGLHDHLLPLAGLDERCGPRTVVGGVHRRRLSAEDAGDRRGGGNVARRQVEERLEGVAGLCGLLRPGDLFSRDLGELGDHLLRALEVSQGCLRLRVEGVEVHRFGEVAGRFVGRSGVAHGDLRRVQGVRVGDRHVLRSGHQRPRSLRVCSRLLGRLGGGVSGLEETRDRVHRLVLGVCQGDEIVAQILGDLDEQFRKVQPFKARVLEHKRARRLDVAAQRRHDSGRRVDDVEPVDGRVLRATGLAAGLPLDAERRAAVIGEGDDGVQRLVLGCQRDEVRSTLRLGAPHHVGSVAREGEFHGVHDAALAGAVGSDDQGLGSEGGVNAPLHGAAHMRDVQRLVGHGGLPVVCVCGPKRRTRRAQQP